MSIKGLGSLSVATFCYFVVICITFRGAFWLSYLMLGVLLVSFLLLAIRSAQVLHLRGTLGEDNFYGNHKTPLRITLATFSFLTTIFILLNATMFCYMSMQWYQVSNRETRVITKWREKEDPVLGDITGNSSIAPDSGVSSITPAFTTKITPAVTTKITPAFTTKITPISATATIQPSLYVYPDPPLITKPIPDAGPPSSPPDPSVDLSMGMLRGFTEEAEEEGAPLWLTLHVAAGLLSVSFVMQLCHLAVTCCCHGDRPLQKIDRGVLQMEEI